MPDQPAHSDPLPQDLTTCHHLIRELLTTVRQQQRRIEQLEHQVHLLSKCLYGPRADRIRPDQPTLFGDSPPNDTPTTPPEPEPPSPPQTTTKPKGHGRNGLPANLKRVTEIVDVPDAVKQATGGVWVKIGEEVSERADVLTPLWQLLKARVLDVGVVHTDDTPIPVQDASREHCRTGRLWCYVSKAGTVYDATETRNRDGPLQFL